MRAASADSVVIWMELTHSAELLLTATPLNVAEHGNTPVQAQAGAVRTVLVGGRHYAAGQLTGLQAAT
ncbi:MAG: hypothetical protein M3347_11375, partial [Armatimonadota bacterium]|nr:hypothetical protein [Armatimonadota bacterium]